MNKKRSGFTLIEVLVVIAIIAVLMAMLIPGMLYLRAQAKRTSMLTQMSKLQQAMDHYISEYSAPPGVYTHQELVDVSEDITMTENSFFALVGGLNYDGGDPPDIATLANDVRNEDGGDSYNVALLGAGAVVKDDAGAYVRQAAFYRANKNEFKDVEGTAGFDNYIPDMVDPVNGQPILIYTAAPYPKDSNDYARSTREVVAVSYDNSSISKGSTTYYGLIWRRLNDDYINAEALSSGGTIINQRDNSLLSDTAVNPDGTAGFGPHTSLGANSNLSWFINGWNDARKAGFSEGNPNIVPQYGAHAVDHGYWLMNAGYDGIYLNKEGNKEYRNNTKYVWNTGSDSDTPYSDYLEERTHWFDTHNDRLIFAHRYYDGTAKGESTVGRERPKYGSDGIDNHYRHLFMDNIQMNWDDTILEGGELDGSIE